MYIPGNSIRLPYRPYKHNYEVFCLYTIYTVISGVTTVHHWRHSQSTVDMVWKPGELLNVYNVVKGVVEGGKGGLGEATLLDDCFIISKFIIYTISQHKSA